MATQGRPPVILRQPHEAGFTLAPAPPQAPPAGAGATRDVSRAPQLSVYTPSAAAAAAAARGSGGFASGAGTSYILTGVGQQDNTYRFSAQTGGTGDLYNVGHEAYGDDANFHVWNQGAAVARFWYDTNYTAGLTIKGTAGMNGSTKRTPSDGSIPSAASIYIFAAPAPCTPIFASDLAWQWRMVPTTTSSPEGSSSVPGLRVVQSQAPTTSNVVWEAQGNLRSNPQTTVTPNVSAVASYPKYAIASAADVTVLLPTGVFSATTGALVTGGAASSPPSSTTSGGIVPLAWQTNFWDTSNSAENASFNTIDLSIPLWYYRSVVGGGMTEFYVVVLSCGSDIGFTISANEGSNPYTFGGTVGPMALYAGAECTSTSVAILPSDQTASVPNSTQSSNPVTYVYGVDPTSAPDNLTNSTRVGINRVRDILRTSGGYLPFNVELNSLSSGLVSGYIGASSNTLFPGVVSFG